MGYDLLPLLGHNSSLAALAGYFIKCIDVYEVILQRTILKDDIGQVAGEHIQEPGTGRFVRRTLRAIHTMVIINRAGFHTMVTANIQAARDAILLHEQRPDLTWPGKRQRWSDGYVMCELQIHASG